MMDKNAIIESGMLERYLLGELSHAESLQLEAILQEDAELRSLYEEMESDFEKMARENAIQPPAKVKQQLMEKVIGDTTPVIPLNENRANKQYLAIAASFALLFGVTAIWLYTQLNKTQESIELVRTQNSELKNELELVMENYDDIVGWYETINDPNAVQFILKGNDKSPNAKAISYVNHANKTVVLNAKELPTLDADHDYQLWADVAGEMIDMGVIPKNTPMIAMKYIDKAESFNITIEPAGGNDHPTVERLISNVYLE
ncbi:MAG: anti-sigma factor [Bacteroidota bacterium]